MNILQVPVEASYIEFLNYGVLGSFAILMIISIKYLIKKYEKQGERAIEVYVSQITNLVSEKKEILEDKELLTDKVFKHLAANEGKLIGIISDNSKAFNRVSESNESVSDAVALLVVSINQRTNETSELNTVMKDILIKNSK